ncbi:J domain-containing protein required for chloroplast accumulation response 1 isoform X2 [Phalaenopsis equestris]|uniref:J domain-containing protein required for chloroplast accumulation response 1 isoform X2 n=1 Tax=Phalaenopsis equestris TaxID=78828 RepID=UPI0009E53219|nr:J domain-containing protein required for chloroplast accumulation response 1 isoform X2 [Phalaenopsis equestris]
MEIISERERILVGYAPRDPFSGAVLSTQRRNSDIDFHDVFGGPPRRSKLYESRRSRADSIDLCSRASLEREDSVECYRSRLGSGEKPVFGHGSGSGRRQLGDDFYSDIFQTSDSSCSSPRRGDREALQSSPGSRINSPNKPTPIRWPTSFGVSSLPQFSLSEKMDKGLTHPSFSSQTQQSVFRNEDDRTDAFNFPLSPNASSTGTTQSVVGHEDQSNKGYSSYRKSTLSRRSSSSFEALLDTIEPAFQTVESQTEKNSSSLEDYVSNQKFHFSIYKWAGKGVMLVMPSDSKERNEFEGRLARFPEIIVQEVELPSNCDYFSAASKAFESEIVTQVKKSDKKEAGYVATTAKGLSHIEFGPELLKDDTNKTTDKCGNQGEKTSAPWFDENSNTSSANEQIHGLKCLSELFDDDIEKQRRDNIPRHVKEREAHSKSQKKQQRQMESRLVSCEVNCTTLHDTPTFSEVKTQGGKVKGKVKEFIKKFNQDGSPKRKGAFEMLVRRSKGEENKLNKVVEAAHVSTIGEDKSQGKSGNKNVSLFDFPNAIENQGMEKAEEDKSGISCDGHPSEKTIEVLPPQSDPLSEVLGDAVLHEENILEDFEAYLVQQLMVNQTEAVQNSPQQDQIKDLDAKIRQWSRGKEGNIRSLLSTLQLVLWPESGWKQVPLVNIIEGASVRKAYQKALLCLHPDKLQQKGASSNQKYIAEKVFDILQEAWDHFNSISEF